jgi:polymorphic toxin system DSP-PTPase phosphatase-like protein
LTSNVGPAGSANAASAAWFVAGTRLAILERPPGGDALSDWVGRLTPLGIDTVVSALESAEEAQLGLASEASLVREAGLRFLSIPIADRGTPNVSATVPELVALGAEMASGRTIAFHCAYGIGRSPMLAAATLVLLGVDSAEAWSRIAIARGQSVPDNEDQSRWVTELGVAAQTASNQLITPIATVR